MLLDVASLVTHAVAGHAAGAGRSTGPSVVAALSRVASYNMRSRAPPRHRSKISVAPTRKGGMGTTTAVDTMALPDALGTEVVRPTEQTTPLAIFSILLSWITLQAQTQKNTKEHTRLSSLGFTQMKPWFDYFYTREHAQYLKKQIWHTQCNRLHRILKCETGVDTYGA